jgi:hypothetical protein
MYELVFFDDAPSFPHERHPFLVCFVHPAIFATPNWSTGATVSLMSGNLSVFLLLEAVRRGDERQHENHE